MNVQFRVGDWVKVVPTFDHNPDDGESPIGKVGMITDIDKDIGWAWVAIKDELWRFDYTDIALVRKGA